MEETNIIPIILFSIFLFFIVVFLILELIKLLFRDFYFQRKERNLITYFKSYPNRTDSTIQNILQHKFAFYVKLNSNDKIKFYVRLKLFLKEKKFVPCQMDEVTIEMKVLIASSAIQLTFGLENFIFHHFKTILVYPKSFLSKYDRNFHKGNVNIKGAISLSFEDFIEGYKNPVDAMNLGLHEMTHALELEFNLKDEYDTFFAAYYEKWLKLALTELIRINYGQSDFLRKYASRNVKEFFAVCVENFFERPVMFKERLPEIYKHLSVMLNQDPGSENFVGLSRINKSREIKITDDSYLYGMKHPIYQKLITYSFLILIFTGVGFFVNELKIFWFFSFLLIVVTAYGLTSSNNIYLYQEVLVVKPVLSNLFSVKMFNLEDIVSVSVLTDNKNGLKITHVVDGKIKYDVFGVLFRKADASELISRFKSLKVFVRKK